MFQRILVRVNTTCSRWLWNNTPWLFSKWELNDLIAYFLKKTKANRFVLNCIFFTRYLVLSWRFLNNQPAACLSKDNYGREIILLWWSVFQQTTATTDCISKSSYMSRLLSIFGQIMLVFYKRGLETVDTDSKGCFC